MDGEDVLWLIGFSSMLVLQNLLQCFIRKALKEKAPGSQSVNDLVLLDTFAFLQLFGNFVSSMACLTKFDFIRQLIVDRDVLLTLACSIYSFTFSCVCVSAICACTVKMIYISRMSFLEETVGEAKARLISASATIFSSVVIVATLLIKNETNSGSFFTLITSNVVHSG